MLRVLRLGLLFTLAATNPAVIVGQSAPLKPTIGTLGPSSTASAKKGIVEGRTYKNPSVGLEFTPAPNLRLNEPEVKGTPGTTPLLITIQALGNSTFFSVRPITVFYADALAYYPKEQRSTERYMQKVIRTNSADGFELVGGLTSAQLGGVPFLRADFDKRAAHETVLVTSHGVYEFVFIFRGSDVDVTNKLIAETTVKFTD